VLSTVFLSVAVSNTLFADTKAHVAAESQLDAGRYLVVVGGCNDCHTPAYAELGSQVPEDEWLTGVAIGWRGPWGTTYASNLRLMVQGMSEDAFVEVLRSRKERPPMPWAGVNQLSRADAAAIYQYVLSLGPKGDLMPTAVGADVEPATPYFLFIPQSPNRMQSAVASPTTQ
jgi:mono/diheme cytochrome c family protein